MIPRYKLWQFRVSLTQLLILTPLFIFRYYSDNPHQYLDVIESGIEFGWLPSVPDLYHQIDFKWHRVWRESRTSLWDWKFNNGRR